MIQMTFIMDASNGHIPTGAIQVIYFIIFIITLDRHNNYQIELFCCFQGGFNEENDPIYIGRAHHEDSYAVGKVIPLFYDLFS